MTYEYGEKRWNYIDRKRKELEEKPVPLLSGPPQSHMDWPGANPDLPVTNRLSHGTLLKTNKSVAEAKAGVTKSYHCALKC
jgi:hypothetical protein